MAEEKTKQMQTQNILVALLVVAALLIGFLYGQNKTLKTTGGAPTAQGAAAQPSPDKPQVGDVDKVTSKDFYKGNIKTAKVALIEYSDFQCPFCANFHPTAEQAVKEYGDKIVWVYRHFPLKQIHPNAQSYAEATECVAEQKGNDGFWKYGDALFAQQATYSALSGDALTKELSALAVKTGVNKAKFDSCFSSHKYAKKIEDLYNGGVKAGVTGTPGNIVMNIKTGKAELIPGAVPFESLKASIDALMN